MARCVAALVLCAGSGVCANDAVARTGPETQSQCALAAHGEDSASSDPDTDGHAEHATSRGKVSIGYQTQATEGLIQDDGSIRGNTTTDTHVVYLALDYRLSDRWEVHVAIPFIRKRSSGGPGAHRLDILEVPHPEARFLDDGLYHSNWQDWGLGVTYHTEWRGFEVTPHVIAAIPAHEYEHFANAAIGQNLWKLKLGVDLTRRVPLTNFYYSLGYSYELWEKVLGMTLNKHHFRLSGGYFFNPQWSLRAFASGRGGLGANTLDFPPSSFTTEEFYQHDRTSEHTFVIAGLSATYRVDDTWSMSATATRMVYGRNVHDLTSAFGIEFARRF